VFELRGSSVKMEAVEKVSVVQVQRVRRPPILDRGRELADVAP
jgi:hypothetical protein